MLTDDQAMEATETATLLSIASPWPIAITLATYLPAGDLINLARTSVLLRTALHGLQPPSEAELQDVHQTRSRAALRIGSHQTSYWKQLKQVAPFLCASSTHTKGSSPRPCRFCSTPICEACIVRDSFAKRAENTFKNRCRFLCKGCWNSGNLHRRSRFKGDPHVLQDGPSRYNFAPGDGEFCACTNKDDGWVCISCKDMQNAEANASGFKLCFGERCSVVLEEDKERRRICLWCDKPMLRGRASMESRLAFDQKMQDARVKRGLSFETRIRKQQKLYKMSRRELRGDDAVAQDPLADAPQFVRHLDTMNYQRFIPRQHAPSGEQVYQSKLGRWIYNRGFLIGIGQRCKRLPERCDVRDLTRRDGEQSERRNLEDWHWRFEKWGERVEQRDAPRRSEQDDDVVCRTANEITHGSSQEMRSGGRAGGVDIQHLRRSFFFPANGKAADEAETEQPESEALENIQDDHAIALALQAELDLEMAEALHAEFVAEAADEVGLTRLKGESEESDLDEESSMGPSAIRNFSAEPGVAVQERKYKSQNEENDDVVSQGQFQSNKFSIGHLSDLGRGDVNCLFVSGSLIAPEQALNSETAAGKLSKPEFPETQSQADVDESDNEAVNQHPLEHSPAEPSPNDRPPPYAG